MISISYVNKKTSVIIRAQLLNQSCTVMIKVEIQHYKVEDIHLHLKTQKQIR